ncbi:MULTISPECIES: hypothetical protein [Streptomyces]|uniref:hypothetical protein n=1 Tax=Streptomyces TaxID=1883 RepID=UPI00067A87E8|nr:MULTISPECIES: hypothetical protein [Streptomyces]
MRTRTTTAALIAAGLLALTACGTTPEPDTKAAGPEPSAEVTETPTAEPTPETPVTLDMGSAWEFESTTDDIEGAVTVLGYKQGVKSVGSAAEESGTPGYEWAYVDMKTCSIRGTFSATTEPWTLAYEDGSRVEPSSTTYDDFPKPEFPFETTLTDGKCVRGKLVFPVPGDQRPTVVVYAPAGLDVPKEWAVPAT